MPTRTLFLILGGLFGVMFLTWAITEAVRSPTPATVPVGRSKKHMICQLNSHLELSGKRVCLYDCEDGTKTRIEGVERCLPKVEV